MPDGAERVAVGRHLAARVRAAGPPVACQVVVVRLVSSQARVGLRLTGPADEPCRARLAA